MTLPLEKQVCSLDLAKRLKELGVKQESLFWWNNQHDGWEINENRKNFESASAFTVAELGELAIKESNVVWCLFHNVKNGIWLIYETGIMGYCTGKKLEFTADTEANVRAKILIYLLENKLLEVSHG